jgi:hypothetical protein
MLCLPASLVAANSVAIEELEYMVETLVSMGYEGAHMCKRFVAHDTYEDVPVTPEQLYNRVMGRVTEAENDARILGHHDNDAVMTGWHST